MVAEELPVDQGQFRPMFGRTTRVGPRSRKRLLDLGSKAEATFVPVLPHQLGKTNVWAMGPKTAPGRKGDEVGETGARGREGKGATGISREAAEVMRAAREEAERILAHARQEAHTVAAEAERQRERVVAEAREATVAQVRQEEQEAFRREVAEFRARLEAAQETTLEGLTQDMAALVADIAEQVIYKAVEADPEATLRAVREALRELPGGGRVRVLVPEEDETTVTEQRAALLTVLREAKDLQVVPDAKLQRGGCIAYSDKGEIDARLETRLRAVREEIERVVA